MNSVQLSMGKFDKLHGSDADSLVKTFAGIAAGKPKSLVLHFHGGLVSRESALESAERLSPLYAAAGADSFFLIWETSAGEIVGQNIQKITNEPIFQAILNRVTEFVKGKLEMATDAPGARGVAGLPSTFASEIQEELDKGKRGEPMFEDVQTEKLSPKDARTPEDALTAEEQRYIEEEVNRDDDLRRHVQNILAVSMESGGKGIDGGTTESTLMDPGVLSEIVPVESAGEFEQSRSILATVKLGKDIVTVVGAVIWRFANRREHGLYLTIVEEIMRAFYVRAAGRFLWTQMKEAVGRAFISDPDYGGPVLVAQLSKLWKDIKPCVTLVGHSAGSIYVARFLKELNAAMDPDFRAHVIFIAPACTFDCLADSLRSAGNRVLSLRIFGMSNTVERQDHLVPAVFPASLLYFVSGVLEDTRDEPLVGMQRYYSDPYEGADFNTVASVKGFPSLLHPYAYAWSQISACDGANCDMVTHGGWADAPQTLASVLYLIHEGCSNE